MKNLTCHQQTLNKSDSEKRKAKVQHLTKQTHIYLHDKYLKAISPFPFYFNLQVLYLHNNDITKIKNLSNLINLKHLYLQMNRIRKMEGLENLKQLRKLYIGQNEISVIEGLENMECLEELHVQKQRLPRCESLCFDPRSMMKLAGSLLVLNVCQNNLTTLKDLAPLRSVQTLTASDNHITEVTDVIDVVKPWYRLVDLNLVGNPLTKQHRYRESLIANTFRLGTLDNKDINETTRNFIKKFEQEKMLNRASTHKIAVNLADIPGDIAPPVKKLVTQSVANRIHKAFSNSILMTNLSEEEAVYVPWQALRPNDQNVPRKYIPPLFMRQKHKGEAKKVQFSTVFPQFP